MFEITDLHAIAAATASGYRNEVVASMNDHELHVSIMDRPYGWHYHPDSDETFLVLEGSVVIESADGAVELLSGCVLTVPAGVRHRTRPGGARSVNVTVERKGANTVYCDGPV